MRELRPAKDFSRDKKRYGWSRLYDDFTGHPKWRLVAARSGVHLGYVHAIVIGIFNAASKERGRGFIGSLDFDVLSVATDIPAENVAAVYRALCDIGWITADHITDWLDRQPPHEDPTAAERQRNKRAKDTARRAMAAGQASPDQVELLSVAEREALARLAQASRVTSAPPAPAFEVVAAFIPIAENDLHPLARHENDRNARVWLLGKQDSDVIVSYGPASKIVADNFGCNRLNADAMIRRWLADPMAGDAVRLATILSQACEQSLINDGFRRVVESRIAEYARERMSGPPLPLGVAAIRGGRP